MLTVQQSNGILDEEEQVMTIYMAKVTKGDVEIDCMVGRPMSDKEGLEKKLFKQGFRIIGEDKWESKSKSAKVYSIQI